MELMDTLRNLKAALNIKISDIETEMREYGFIGHVWINSSTVSSLQFDFTGDGSKFIVVGKDGNSAPLLDCDTNTKIAMSKYVNILYAQMRDEIKLKIKELKSALRGQNDPNRIGKTEVSR